MERQFHGNESSLYGLFAPRNESAEEQKGLESTVPPHLVMIQSWIQIPLHSPLQNGILKYLLAFLIVTSQFSRHSAK